MSAWWRAAFYPWGYPHNPDKKPDAALCPECGPLVQMRWEPGLAVVTYISVVHHGERCMRCGMVQVDSRVVGG